MSGEMNVLIMAFTLLVMAGAVTLILKHQMKKEVQVQIKKKQEHLEMHYLSNEIKEMMFQLTTRHFEDRMGSKEVHERELNKRIQLKKALRGCSNGSMEDKSYIIDFIADLLKPIWSRKMKWIRSWIFKARISVSQGQV